MNLLYIVAFLAVVAVGVASAFIGRALYLRQVRRSLVRLLSMREAVTAAANGLDRVIEHLLSAGDESLVAFAEEPRHEDRRAVEDVASRARIAADELHTLALPKHLWPVAESMEKAAREIAKQAGAVGEADTPDGVLDALGAVDVATIANAIGEANETLEPLLREFGVSEPAVYGGGLYI